LQFAGQEGAMQYSTLQLQFAGQEGGKRSVFINSHHSSTSAPPLTQRLSLHGHHPNSYYRHRTPRESFIFDQSGSTSVAPAQSTCHRNFINRIPVFLEPHFLLTFLEHFKQLQVAEPLGVVREWLGRMMEKS
jgi:hypothetical protein